MITNHTSAFGRRDQIDTDGMANNANSNHDAYGNTKVANGTNTGDLYVTVQTSGGKIKVDLYSALSQGGGTITTPKLVAQGLPSGSRIGPSEVLIDWWQ